MSPLSKNQASRTRGVLVTAAALLTFLLALPWFVLTGTGTSDPQSGEVPDQYVAHVREAGTRCPGRGISAPVIAAQIHAESAWNPQARSPVGAQGLAQFMPATWATWGTDYDRDGTSSPLDPPDAIGSQADYLCHLAGWAAEQRQHGVIDGDPLSLTLAAYNAGPANVATHGGVPPFPETQNYIATIHDLIPRATLA